NELAQSRVRHMVLGAELVQETASLDAEPCLERTGWMVQPGVDHAAVVRARLEAGARVPLQYAHRPSGSCDRERRRDPRDARADDGDVDPLHEWDFSGRDREAIEPEFG